jgi:glycosyltransferase involved in cell wall biosynthesis
MRILLIAYSFPPFQDGQSLRWYYLSNALAGLGVKIDVVTVKHPFKDQTSWHYHKNIEVMRIYPGPIEFFALKAKKGIGVEDEGNEALRTSLRFKIMKSSYWGIRNFAGNILPGDIRTEWLPFAIRFIRKRIDISNYDFLVTSHEPWVDSLLGLYFKKGDPKIRWVADLADPYVALYTPRHKLWFENYFEKWICENASILIFTNGKVIDHLVSKYPFLKGGKLWVIEQGFDHRFSAEKEHQTHRNRIFTLTYTGTFYRGFRDPSNLIKALSTLDFEYEFILAGRNEKFINDFKILRNNFKFLGVVDHFETLKLQRESDVLVHLANKDSSIQIPGKFYEYLGALKPILTIHHDKDDPTKRLVEEFRCGIACKDDPEEIKNSLKILYHRWKENENVCPTKAEQIYQYSWEKKAQTIYERLKESVLRN